MQGETGLRTDHAIAKLIWRQLYLSRLLRSALFLPTRKGRQQKRGAWDRKEKPHGNTDPPTSDALGIGPPPERVHSEQYGTYKRVRSQCVPSGISSRCGNEYPHQELGTGSRNY